MQLSPTDHKAIAHCAANLSPQKQNFEEWLAVLWVLSACACSPVKNQYFLFLGMPKAKKFSQYAHLRCRYRWFEEIFCSGLCHWVLWEFSLLKCICFFETSKLVSHRQSGPTSSKIRPAWTDKGVKARHAAPFWSGDSEVWTSAVCSDWNLQALHRYRNRPYRTSPANEQMSLHAKSVAARDWRHPWNGTVVATLTSEYSFSIGPISMFSGKNFRTLLIENDSALSLAYTCGRHNDSWNPVGKPVALSVPSRSWATAHDGWRVVS